MSTASAVAESEGRRSPLTLIQSQEATLLLFLVGVVVFSVNAHCLDASGTQHTGTDGLVYQYQDR